MLLVAEKSAFVAVPVGVDVLALACPFSVHIVSVILVAIGVNCKPLPCVVPGRVASLALCVGELIGSSTLFFGH